jgi:hypothetical protein
MSYIEYGSWNYKRPIFRLYGNIYIPRPSVYVEAAIGLAALTLYGYLAWSR